MCFASCDLAWEYSLLSGKLRLSKGVKRLIDSNNFITDLEYSYLTEPTVLPYFYLYLFIVTANQS